MKNKYKILILSFILLNRYGLLASDTIPKSRYISVDFHNHVLSIYKKGDREIHPGIPEIVSEKSTCENNDALNLEIIAFIDSIKNGTPIIVSGEDGRRALHTAIRISALLT